MLILCNGKISVLLLMKSNRCSYFFRNFVTTSLAVLGIDYFMIFVFLIQFVLFFYWFSDLIVFVGLLYLFTRTCGRLTSHWCLCLLISELPQKENPIIKKGPNQLLKTIVMDTRPMSYFVVSLLKFFK